MNDEKLKEFIKYIEAVPNIPTNDRGKEYYRKCLCGGTITAWRVKTNGHMRVKCDRCDFKLIE